MADPMPIQAVFKSRSLLGGAGQSQAPVGGAPTGPTPYANIPARPGDRKNRQGLLDIGARSIADIFYPMSRFSDGG